MPQNFLMICIIFTKKNTTKKKKIQIKKDIQKFDYKKLRLRQDYLYESEEELDEKPDKLDKKPLKKPTKDDVGKFNNEISGDETGIIGIYFKNVLVTTDRVICQKIYIKQNVQINQQI